MELPTIAPHDFHVKSWDDLVRYSGKDTYDFHDYLKSLLPSAQTNDLKIIELAFRIMGKDEMVELNWQGANPMAEVSVPGGTSINYHSTSPLRVPFIRRDGLLPSKSGAKSDVPALYTSPLRTTCMRSYCDPCIFPPIKKTIAVMFGVYGSEAGSLRRKRGNIQKWYAPGDYTVCKIQFLCTDGERQSLDELFRDLSSKRAREVRRRVRQADEPGENAMVRLAWSDAIRRRHPDFPYRRYQKARHGSIKISIAKFKKRLRRQRRRSIRAPGASKL